MTAVAPTRRATWHDAYDAQMQLWRWTRPEQHGPRWLGMLYRNMCEDLQEKTKEMLAGLFAHENRKLLDADPIFVSAEMGELVSAAMESFEPEALLPTDIVSPHGFMYFEEPLQIRDQRGQDIDLRAVCWSPVIGSNIHDLNPGELPGRAVDGRDDLFYAKPDEMMGHFKGKDYASDWADSAGNVDGIAITLYEAIPGDHPALERYASPRLVPIHITPWWFGMPFDGNEFDETGKFTGAEWWWKAIQTTFRLMQQQLATRSRYGLDRSGRREAKKYGHREREITVVRLRRERSTNMPEGPHEEAHYSHRFVVGGHWRNQWYPGSNVHRQIWISPYVKGPEDAPLLVKPRRAYTWTR